jgi:DNA-binding NarL/FixJ family response regulator
MPAPNDTNSAMLVPRPDLAWTIGRSVPAAEPAPRALEVTAASPCQTRGSVLEEIRAYRRSTESRNSLIERAIFAGFSETDIAREIGHSRTTVRSALGR